MNYDKIEHITNLFFKFAQALQAVEKDRFQGAAGEERQQLIQAEAAKKGFSIVPKQRTPLNESAVITSIYNIINNEFPNLSEEEKKEFALTLATQVRLETGLKSSWNWNVGNIHATSAGQNKFWKGKVSVWDDPQIDKSGKQYVNKDWFWRAYDTLEDGIGDWFGLLKKRFPEAINEAIKGDAYAFGKALGQKGYYTADKERYSKSLVKLKENMRKSLV